MTYGQYAARRRPVGIGALFSRHPRRGGRSSLFAKQTDASSYQSYGSDVYGATLSLGTPLTEQIGMQWRYSISRQNVTLDPASLAATPSLPIQQAALAGPQWVSAVGDTVSYNTLDNTKNPTSGFSSQLKQDLAGLGGDVNFLRTTEDVRYYQSLNSDLVGMVRAQGGYITGYGGQQVPLIDSFFGGPQLVRGFAPNGFGPRDLTPGTTMDNVGGSMYWATTAELQSAIPGVPQEYGLKALGLRRCRQRVSLRRPDDIPGLHSVAAARQCQHHALVGRRRPDLGLAVRCADRQLRACRSPRRPTTWCSRSASAPRRSERVREPPGLEPFADRPRRARGSNRSSTQKYPREV